jgi:hypothetical protein
MQRVRTPGGMVMSLYLSALYGAIRGRRAVTPYDSLRGSEVNIRESRSCPAGWIWSRAGSYLIPSSMTPVWGFY